MGSRIDALESKMYMMNTNMNVTLHANMAKLEATDATKATGAAAAPE
jgi:hypothetical protein